MIFSNKHYDTKTLQFDQSSHRVLIKTLEDIQDNWMPFEDIAGQRCVKALVTDMHKL